jgi:hypothetical protein
MNQVGQTRPRCLRPSARYRDQLNVIPADAQYPFMTAGPHNGFDLHSNLPAPFAQSGPVQQPMYHAEPVSHTQ